MGRIVVTEFVSLDGVTEDPGASESFKHGGWTFEIDRGEGPAREQRVSLRLFFDTPKTRLNGKKPRRAVALIPLPSRSRPSRHSPSSATCGVALVSACARWWRTRRSAIASPGGQPAGEHVRGDDGAGDLRPDGGADVAHNGVDAGGFAGLMLVDRADDEVGDRGEGGADTDAGDAAPEDDRSDGVVGEGHAQQGARGDAHARMRESVTGPPPKIHGARDILVRSGPSGLIDRSKRRSPRSAVTSEDY